MHLFMRTVETGQTLAALRSLSTLCAFGQANNFAADGADGDEDVVLMAGDDGGSTAVRVPRQVLHVR